MRGPCTCCHAPDCHPQAGYELPLCDACAQARSGRGLEFKPDERSGAVVANVLGVDETGHRPSGSSTWDWLPEGWETVGGVRLWLKPDPPVHVRGEHPVAKGRARATPERLRTAAIQLEAAGCTEAQRDAILLQVQGLTVEQIAGYLGVGIESVKDRLTRGKRKLGRNP